MTVLTLRNQPVVDFTNPNRKVKWEHADVYGHPVYGGLRTIAHLDATSAKAERKFGQRIEVIQGGFNTGVPASKGTHDYDGWVDCFIPGVDWWVQQRFYRAEGWAAFYRYPPLFGSHVHMGSLGCTGRMGIYCAGQFDDYLNTPPRNGLAGHAVDTTWHPGDIHATIFDFAKWVKTQEDDMPKYEDWSQASKNALKADVATEVVDRLLAAKIETDLTVKGALRTAQNAPGLIRTLGRLLGHPLNEEKK